VLCGKGISYMDKERNSLSGHFHNRDTWVTFLI